MTISSRLCCPRMFVASGLTTLLLAGCSLSSQTPQGASIQIQGPANDTVHWTAAQNPYPPSCACLATENGGKCKDLGNQPLPSGPVQSNNLVNGPTINNVVDDSAITATAIAGPTPCMTPQPVLTLACPNNPGSNPTPVACVATNPFAAQGHVTVTGSEDSTSYQKCMRWFAGGDCAKWETVDVYNHDTVSLTLNGQTVSVSYGESSTAFSLGFALAQAVDQNSTLAVDLMAAPNGPVVYVNAINTGTQYDYPWTSSCTYNATYFLDCSFTAGLSPAASLTSPQ